MKNGNHEGLVTSEKGQKQIFFMIREGILNELKAEPDSAHF